MATGERPLSPPSRPRVPRNFDEVISCFANVPKDTPLFSKAQTSVYCEEDGKVGAGAGSPEQGGPAPRVL